MTATDVIAPRLGGKVVAVGFFALLLVSYHMIFSQFFPTHNGTMGHDWHWLSGYLFAYSAYLQNGIPFFSDGNLFSTYANPAACHASASFGLSFPKNPFDVLVWAGLSPIAIAYAQFLSFASIGYWGMLLLLRRTFLISLPVSIFGAGIFMFNGFYVSRIMIGHGYFAVMLLPFILYLLTSQSSVPGRSVPGQNLRSGVLAGLVAYYAVLFGVQVIAAGSLLAILGGLAIWLLRGGSFRTLIVRSLYAGAIALGLSFALLYATISSPVTASAMAQRINYSLPVFRGLGDALYVLAQMLFIAPANIEQIYNARIINISIAQQRHELEFGIGFISLLVLIIFFSIGLLRWLRADTWWLWRANGRQWLMLLLLACILLFPLIYTTNFSVLLSFIKSIPIINATTSPQRTYLIYVVLLPVITSLALEYVLSGWRQYGYRIVGLLLLAMVGQTAATDRTFYQNQPYDPTPIQQAHQVLKDGHKTLPPIETINMLADENGNLLHNQMIEANLFLYGIQHMGCYIPFYNSVPVALLGTLHPGSVWDVNNGYLNIKNPACNVWPKENNCEAGGHFTLEQKDWVERYIHYQSFPMNVPAQLRYATYLQAVFFFATLFLLIGTAIGTLANLLKRHSRT
jgi:hypothetical protein